MNHRVQILGIGSPFGDDRLGWEAAEALRRSDVPRAVAPGRIEVLILDRPGALLPMYWRDADVVILMDAFRSGAAPGTRHELDARELAGCCAPDSSHSSHGFGVVRAIELARALDDLPPRLLLRGLEVDPAWTGCSLSPAVAGALPPFVAAIAREALGLANLCPSTDANRV